MADFISFFQNLFAHPGIAIAAFALVSSVLTAVAAFLVAQGKAAPGWIGTVISLAGSAIHLLNGSTPASSATPPAA